MKNCKTIEIFLSSAPNKKKTLESNAEKSCHKMKCHMMSQNLMSQNKTALFRICRMRWSGPDTTFEYSYCTIPNMIDAFEFTEGSPPEKHYFD